MANVFCLFGPTASGKTRLALTLVKKFPFEIISVDSAMVYRGMDIGTATPTVEELQIAPHRLINFIDPAQSYSAGQFCRDATREIDAILAQGRVPLLVGGTMLYFALLQRGFYDFPQSDPLVCQQLTAEAQIIGWPAMHAKLVAVDPVTAKSLHPNDAQRIQRALALYYTTGKPMSAHKAEQQWRQYSHQFINLALIPISRQVLHQRIEERFDHMLNQGFVREVELLLARGDLSPSLPAMRMVGYRQIWRYLQGSYNYQEMRERGIIATRQLVKRQLTWLRRWKTKIDFNSESPQLVAEVSRKINDS